MAKNPKYVSASSRCQLNELNDTWSVYVFTYLSTVTGTWYLHDLHIRRDDVFLTYRR